MNETEIGRIAAAANALRPDWPIGSLTTLLKRPELANRPRRDVAVALAWVACDSGTKTPARVIEAGPWWKAAVVEGGDAQPIVAWDDRCMTCTYTEEACKRAYGGEHAFVPNRDRHKVPPRKIGCPPHIADALGITARKRAREAQQTPCPPEGDPA